MSAVLNVKDAGEWECMNFNGKDVHVKDGGVWVTPTTVRVKDGGAWVIVWPSTSTAWTTSNASTAVTAEATTAKPQLTGYGVDSASWSGRSSSEGEGVQFSTFGWSPTTTVGFLRGAVAQLEVSFTAQSTAPPPGRFHYIRVRAVTGYGTYQSTGALTTSSDTYTLQFPVATWNISDTQAGGIHLSDTKIRVTPKFDNATAGVDGHCSIGNLKARINYYYN